MANLNLWAKWGFAVLVIVSFAILIERLTAKNYRWSSELEVIEEPLVTTFPLLLTTEAEGSILNENFTICLIEHTKHFMAVEEKVLLHSDNPDGNDIQEKFINNSSPCVLPPGLCMHYLLLDFVKLMTSLEIKLQAIEPSVLFCLLSPARKYNLLTRGFRPAKMRGIRNVMTFGVTEKETEILNEDSNRKKIMYSGFKMRSYPEWAEYRTRNQQTGETFQYFFKKDFILIHLVVFYQRETYLWHPGLNTSEIFSKRMVFAEDGAYDNFTTSPMSLDRTSTSQVYLPSDPRCFLLAVDSSKFLECKNTSLDKTSELNDIQENRERLKSQVLAALKEVKRVLASQMVSFWLWARTLQGWYEHCDILHHSSGVELSIARQSVEGYNFTGLFAGSVCHAVKQDFNLSTGTNVELKCQEIDVKIAFMKEDDHVALYTYETGLSSYRQAFPAFAVCSTDVFGLKVNVPCDTNKIFEMEFGQNWKNTSLIFKPENMINLSVMNNSSKTPH